MRSISAEQALRYVSGLELPARKGYESLETVNYGFDTTKNQAMVVGADIVSFVQGVTPERREDIVNSSLLAQLAAKKRVSDPKQIYDWYNTYFDVLTNIGWVIQDQGFATYSEQSEGFEAHEAILKVATVLLGPTATALAIVTATVNSLKSMSSDSPWITLFNRESQSANTARFQVTLAEQTNDDQLLVSLMAFGLEATATLTQVLFFKLRANEATLKHYSGKVTINAHVLSNVRDAIKKRIAGFAKGYVEALPPLG
jgi:hypothetical protein